MFDTIYNGRFEYGGAIAAKFLYEFAGAEPGIGFIKQIFYNNMSAPLTFHNNLIKTCSLYGYSWSNLLARFAKGIYFTAERSDPRYFISGSESFFPYNYGYDTLDENLSIRKKIRPYGRERFVFGRGGSNEMLKVIFKGAGPYSVDEKWAACLLLIPTTYSVPDTIIDMAVDDSGYADFIITNWQSYSEGMVIASNPNPIYTREATVSLQVPESDETTTDQKILKETAFSSANSIHKIFGPDGKYFGEITSGSYRWHMVNHMRCKASVVISLTKNRNITQQQFKKVLMLH